MSRGPFQTFASREGTVPFWRQIPAGQGWIGSPDDEEERHDDEGPRHLVDVVRPFWLSATPITEAQYTIFDAAKSHRGLPCHPVVQVSWDDAMGFCRWLDEEKGFRGARLPTEREWEYACRAGASTAFWSGDTIEDLEPVAWYRGNSGGRTNPVGEKLANPWGLYDVHGNVSEWTASRWTDGHSSSSLVKVDSSWLPADLATEPDDRAQRSARVVRGGGNYDFPRDVRAAFRVSRVPWNRAGDLGFRVLLPFAPGGG